MGGACGTYGGEKEMQQGFGRKPSEERAKKIDNFYFRGLDGRIILIWIFIHCVVSLTNGPQPLSQRVLHSVRYSASYFNFKYPLFFLTSSSSCLGLPPRLPVTCPFF
jgi:hypothetical protein